MAIIIVTLMMTTPVIGSEDYDARKDYSNKECAEMFHPEYDREGYLTCTGGIGIPNPDP
jgi:hypothetical protein